MSHGETAILHATEQMEHCVHVLDHADGTLHVINDNVVSLQSVQCVVIVASVASNEITFSSI